MFGGFGLVQIVHIIALFIALDVHEFCHAWMADELGDPTPRYMGRLSLDPRVHLDPLGTLMIIVSSLSGFGFGWGKPVRVNPYNLRYGPRVGLGMVAFAGPLANLFTASLMAVPIRLGLPLPWVIVLILKAIVVVNIGLAVFNLIPLPPLDGFSVLMGILSTIRAPWAYRWSYTLSQYEAQGPMLLLLLIMLDWFLPIGIFDLIIGPPFYLLRRLILGS